MHRYCQPDEPGSSTVCDHLIDTVWFDVDMDATEVKRSLVEHDGYPDDIVVLDASVCLWCDRGDGTHSEACQRATNAEAAIEALTRARRDP